MTISTQTSGDNNMHAKEKEKEIEKEKISAMNDQKYKNQSKETHGLLKI